MQVINIRRSYSDVEVISLGHVQGDDMIGTKVDC